MKLMIVMMKLSLCSSLLLSGCVLGPIEITHKDGHVPKLHVNLPTDDCKIRVKVRLHDVRGKLECNFKY